MSSLNPVRLIHLALFGCVLLLLASAVTFLPFPHPDARLSLLASLYHAHTHLACFLVPLLTGAALEARAYTALTHGIRNDRWSPDQLSRARTFIQQPAITWLPFLALFAAIAEAIFIPAHHRFNAMVFLPIYATMPFGHMRRTLQPPAPTLAGTPLDWSAVQPLHSSQWGRHSKP